MCVGGQSTGNPNPHLTRRELVFLAAEFRMGAQSAGRAFSFVDTSFGRIACTEQRGGPAAIFLHGLLFSGYFWRNVTARVAGMRRTIAIDLMAHGATRASASQDVSLPAQAEMIEAVCDKLDLGQMDLVGNDCGGGVAQIFAARHPARIRTLALTDCVAYDTWPGEGAVRLRKAAEQNLPGDVIRKGLNDLTLARAAFARVLATRTRRREWRPAPTLVIISEAPSLKTTKETLK
jgi:pimeloyl-ACP methyl ester carboxylesterase